MEKKIAKLWLEPEKKKFIKVYYNSYLSLIIVVFLI